MTNDNRPSAQQQDQPIEGIMALILATLVWAMIIGFSFYGEVLDTTTLIGAALVVDSGV